MQCGIITTYYDRLPAVSQPFDIKRSDGSRYRIGADTVRVLCAGGTQPGTQNDWIGEKTMNPGLELEGVVFTMYDARTNLSLEVVENVKSNLNETIY